MFILNGVWFNHENEHCVIFKAQDCPEGNRPIAARSRKAPWFQVGYVVNQIIMFKDNKSVEVLPCPSHCGLES